MKFVVFSDIPYIRTEFMSNICLKKTIGFLLERHNASIQVTLALRTIEESVTRLLTKVSNNIY